MTITPDCRCLIGTCWRVGTALLLERQRAPLIRDTCDPRSLRHPVTTLAAVAILLSPHMNISLSHTDVHITDAIGAPLTAYATACTTSMCNACNLAPKLALLSTDSTDVGNSRGSKESGCFHSGTTGIDNPLASLHQKMEECLRMSQPKSQKDMPAKLQKVDLHAWNLMECHPSATLKRS